MAKQKNLPLSPSGIDVNALGVSGAQPEKPKRKGRSCLTNLMFIVIALGFLAYTGSLSKPKDPTPAAALAATSTPIGAATKVPMAPTFTVTPYPDITMTATQPATVEQEEASLKELPAVDSVERIERRGTDYFAIVKTWPKFNKESFADLMLIQAIKVDLYITRFAAQIDDGESEPLWWIYVDNVWSSSKEPPAWVDLGTQSESIAATIPAAVVATIAPTADAVRAINSKTYYAEGVINVRACADTTCDLVVALAQGDSVMVNGEIDGKAVNSGNKIWYRVTVGGKTGYVYSDLVNTAKPATTSSSGSSGGGSTGNSGGNANGGQSVTPMQEAPKVWDCSGDHYNCDSFGSRADMRSYFEQCPGDPSNLDGNADGQYCESN